MKNERLDAMDVELIERSMRLLEAEGSADDLAEIERLRQKIEHLGVANKVCWGHDLSVYLHERMSQLERREVTLDEFNDDVDRNFTHGRNEQRDAFMTAVKELATKIASVTMVVEKPQHHGDAK